MPRLKSKDQPLIEIRDWEAADKILAELADMYLAVKAVESRAAGQIEEAKLELAEAVGPVHEKIGVRVRSLEAFANGHRDEFGPQRSRKLNFGKMGWRKSTSISVSKKTLGLIKEVFSKARAALFIHVKETPDKEALAKLTDRELAEVGARRKVTDEFFADPDIPEAVDYSD